MSRFFSLAKHEAAAHLAPSWPSSTSEGRRVSRSFMQLYELGLSPGRRSYKRKWRCKKDKAGERTHSISLKKREPRKD